MAICMWTFLQLLDSRQPKWQLDGSIIGTNPGLGFRPTPPEVASSVIWYRGSDPGSYQYWVNELSSFLKSKCSFKLLNTHTHTHTKMKKI